MDIIVCLKQIVDLKQVRIKKETREAILEGLPLLFSDMDINALEEGVKIKEKVGGKVIALAVGTLKLKETIKDALARGADEAVLLTDPVFAETGYRGKADILARAIKKIGRYDLILMGEGSTDNYSGQAVARLAEILNIPAVGYVNQLELADGKFKATRNLEDSLEVVELPSPAIIAVTSEINKPRIPALSAILKAGRKPMAEWKSTDLGVTAAELGGKDVAVLSSLAPVESRKNIVYEGKPEENINNIIDSLIKEGVWGR
jgi:electron transfer flavoprotein beta subunit